VSKACSNQVPTIEVLLEDKKSKFKLKILTSYLFCIKETKEIPILVNTRKAEKLKN
jgi:hypothetical protein